MEAGATATDLLGRFLRVQRQRAEHYAGFTAMFRTYLSGRNEVVFREGVQQTTAAFGSCSQQVRELEAGLREGLGRDDLAAVLRSIQEHEREKLRLTLALQSLRQAHAFEAFSWQQEDPEDIDILEPRAPRTCGCGSAGAHAANGASHDPSGGVHAEPTEAEYKLAVQEAQLALDQHIQGINERIEEIREEIRDCLIDLGVGQE